MCAERVPTGRYCSYYLGGACSPKTESSVALQRETFDTPRHPRHNGNACVPRRPIKELQPGVFPSLPPSLPSLLLENHAAHCKKKKKKKI